MQLVIDANIVFAALIKAGSTADLITSPKLKLYSPPFLFDEFEKYKSYLLDKTHRTSADFQQYLVVLKSNVHSIPLYSFQDYYAQAKELSPDPKDALYFALALKLKCPIWTNDKRLKNQGEIKILGTTELMQSFV